MSPRRSADRSGRYHQELNLPVLTRQREKERGKMRWGVPYPFVYPRDCRSRTDRAEASRAELSVLQIGARGGAEAGTREAGSGNAGVARSSFFSHFLISAPCRGLPSLAWPVYTSRLPPGPLPLSPLRAVSGAWCSTYLENGYLTKHEYLDDWSGKGRRRAGTVRQAGTGRWRVHGRGPRRSSSVQQPARGLPAACPRDLSSPA